MFIGLAFLFLFSAIATNFMRQSLSIRLTCMQFGNTPLFGYDYSLGTGDIAVFAHMRVREMMQDLLVCSYVLLLEVYNDWG